MSHRPLVLVSGLTVGDYLLWNWSLGSNRDVLALVSGLTLPALAFACLWLLALSLVRLMARSARRSTGRSGAGDQRGHAHQRRGPADGLAPGEPPVSGEPPDTPSRKLAA